jgi:hypothetical protein
MASSPSIQPIAPQGSIFAVKEFRTIWFARFVSILGDVIALFAIISLICSACSQAARQHWCSS